MRCVLQPPRYSGCSCLGYFCVPPVHVWPINKDPSVHVTAVCGQRSAAPCGPLLDSEGVDYG